MGLKNVLSKINRTVNPIARGRIEKEKKQKFLDDFQKKQKMKNMARMYPRVRSDISIDYNLKDFNDGDRYGRITTMKKQMKDAENTQKAYDNKYPRK